MRKKINESERPFQPTWNLPSTGWSSLTAGPRYHPGMAGRCCHLSPWSARWTPWERPSAAPPAHQLYGCTMIWSTSVILQLIFRSSPECPCFPSMLSMPRLKTTPLEVWPNLSKSCINCQEDFGVAAACGFPMSNRKRSFRDISPLFQGSSDRIMVACNMHIKI